jgi:peptidoglycan/LPS O-acetylase OafA/YrhL
MKSTVKAPVQTLAGKAEMIDDAVNPIRGRSRPSRPQLMPYPRAPSPLGTPASIVALDLLRASAAFLVFFGHVKQSSFVAFGDLPAAQQGLATKIFFGLARLGHESVMVFFVLSGFLVGGQIIRHVREGRFSVTSYALDRSTRILLPLIPACLLTVAIGWFVFGEAPSALQAALNMIGLNGVLVDTLPLNVPLWALAYEIWFYLLAGVIGYLFSARRASPLALLVLGCSVCVFSVLYARYLLFWCLGALCVLFLGTAHRRALAVIGLVLTISGVLAYQLSVDAKLLAKAEYFPQAIAEALICIGISMAIPFLCDDRLNASISVLRKPARYLSALSYTLYLVHFPLNAVLAKLFPQSTDLSWTSIGIFATKIVLIWAVVTVFFLAFEANTASLRCFLKARLLDTLKCGQRTTNL